MRSTVKLSLMIMIIMCLTIGFGAVRADTLDRIVAMVNGEIILYSELQEQIHQLAKTAPDLKLDDPVTRSQAEREVLQQMIRDRLADAEIKRLKIVVTPREVDEAIDGIRQENHFTDSQFDYVIQQQGKTRAQFRDEIKKQLERDRLIDRVLKSKTIVTQEQVDAYLKSEQGGSLEKRRLAIIFLPYPEGADAQKTGEVDKLARDVVDRLKGGADFSKLAKDYSKGPAAQDGGDLGYVTVDELSPPIEAATRGLKPNEVANPIKTPSGYFILKVLDIRQEKQAANDSSTREKARRQLLQIEMNRKFQDWVKDLESRAFIQVSL